MRIGKTSFAVSDVGAGSLQAARRKSEIMAPAVRNTLGLIKLINGQVSIISFSSMANVSVYFGPAWSNTEQLRLLCQCESGCTIIAAQRFLLKRHCGKAASAGIPTSVQFSHFAKDSIISPASQTEPLLCSYLNTIYFNSLTRLQAPI